jgi:hypothetical protein
MDKDEFDIKLALIGFTFKKESPWSLVRYPPHPHQMTDLLYFKKRNSYIFYKDRIRYEYDSNQRKELLNHLIKILEDSNG